MKLAGIIGTAVLSLAIAAPVYAQQEQHDQKEEEKAKPEEKKAQPEKSAKQDEKAAPQAKPEKQAQRVAGGRIPADTYKAHFGSSHTFRVSQTEYSSGRFQYGGYWFGFGGAWPSNWLYTQDVFVVEIDGVYYLCNAAYPGVNLVLNITL